MLKFARYLRHSLVTKLIVGVGIILLVLISTWAYFSIRYQKERLREDIVAETERLGNTIKLGAHYAMMHNSRDDINQIILNISNQEGIESIRIYNKQGEIKFSNHPAEVDQTGDIQSEACNVCHRADPPSTNSDLEDRTRIIASPRGYRLLGVISPIPNQPGCSTNTCHFHPPRKKILGVLDIVISLEELDKEILFMEKGIIGLAAMAFVVISAIILVLVLKFVNRPIRQLIKNTLAISKGDYSGEVTGDQFDEVGQLATAINQMSREIGEKQAELNKPKKSISDFV